MVEVLQLLRPEWRTLRIHESSPSLWFFREHCPQYSYSYFFPEVARGGSKDGVRCENVEELTFSDESLDVFVTQDVLEHVFRPDRALREISRVLVSVASTSSRPRGIRRSRRVGAALASDDGSSRSVLDPVYHGNPIARGGSLVTWDYGADFDQLAQQWSGFRPALVILRDRRRGIDGEHLEVFVTGKGPGERRSEPRRDLRSLAANGVSQCEQVGPSEPVGRLEHRALGPLVPGVDEHETLVRRAVEHRVDGGRQPSTECVRVRPVPDVRLDTGRRAVLSNATMTPGNSRSPSRVESLLGRARPSRRSSACCRGSRDACSTLSPVIHSQWWLWGGNPSEPSRP